MIPQPISFSPATVPLFAVLVDHVAEKGAKGKADKLKLSLSVHPVMGWAILEIGGSADTPPERVLSPVVAVTDIIYCELTATCLGYLPNEEEFVEAEWSEIAYHQGLEDIIDELQAEQGDALPKE